MQIMVLGMHRSGTSSFTRIINLLGAYVGDHENLLPPLPENPKGFWERKELMHVNDALLFTQGYTWEFLADLGKPFDLGVNRTLTWLASKVISALVTPYQRRLRRKLDDMIRETISRLEPFDPWVLKDPRLCLTLDAWKPHLRAPVAVLVYRDPRDVAKSLQVRQAIEPRHSLALWEFYTVAALNSTRDIPRIFVSYEDLLADPVATAANMFHRLEEIGVQGLTMPTDSAIRDFVDVGLNHANKNDLRTDLALSAELKRITAIMRGKQPLESALTVSTSSREIMARLEDKQKDRIRRFNIDRELTLIECSLGLVSRNGHVLSQL